jgi:hypothetical protein
MQFLVAPLIGSETGALVGPSALLDARVVLRPLGPVSERNIYAIGV